MTEVPVYKKKDFVSDQDVKWCPGCGDYAILASVQLAMTKIGKKKEDICFISGIGCSSRFPYYMDTFGMHTIHGRAPAFVTGLKVHNPSLTAWMITGDGDGLSIGGNHTIHLIRRNVDVNVILFNNEIYGLTKGQYSPTSEVGKVTKSTPMGSIDRPFRISRLALGAGSAFFARTFDTDPKHMQEVFIEASKFKGTSYIEVMQNCIIFNDKVHEKYANRSNRTENSLVLKNGQPMLFGENNDKGIRLNGFTPEVVKIGENGVTEADIVIHDETNANIASMLANFEYPDFPVPVGVFRRVETPAYDEGVCDQVVEAKDKFGEGDMLKLLHSGDTWTVE